MILDKKIEIRISSSNFKHFTDCSYKNLKVGKTIIVSVEHLTKGSHIKIEVKCDICGGKKYLSYNKYLKNIKKHNIYSCEKCKGIKIKITKEEKYGNENYNNLEKAKETNLKNHGVENPFQSEEIKKQSKQTKLKNHGDENYNNRDQAKETCLSNHGVEWSMQSSEIREKGKITKKEKYGNENYNNLEKAKETCLEKYGDENYRNTEKYKQTSIKKFGVEHPMQNIEIFNKTQKSRFKLKDYILPSGKVVKIQGYEHLALDILLKIYNENDLFINNQDIENKIGKIWYVDENNKTHRYFPDIYIISENKIIEVKSTYTFNIDKDINLLKKQACLYNKIDFEFIIF